MRGKKKESEDFELEDEAVADMEIADEEERHEDKLKKLREDLKACQKERQEHLDGWQRERADFLNYKRRAAEEKEREREQLLKRFIEKLLPLADSFDEAFKSPAWQDADPAWKSGIEATRAQLQALLRDHDVVEIEAFGKDFDPREHEAVSHDGDGDIVVAVLQKGYKLGDTIIRPARVAVGTKPQ